MYVYIYIYTWWLIPLSKWVITPVINGISRVNPLTKWVVRHQVYILYLPIKLLNLGMADPSQVVTEAHFCCHFVQVPALCPSWRDPKKSVVFFSGERLKNSNRPIGILMVIVMVKYG